MSDEKLGHLVRKWRHSLTTFGVNSSPVSVPADDLQRLVDAADTGLYWSVEVGLKMQVAEKQVRQSEQDYDCIRKDRDQLRALFSVDKLKIEKLGFEDLDELVYWVEEAQKQGVKVPDRETVIPDISQPDLPF